MSLDVVILGVFMADTSHRASPDAPHGRNDPRHILRARSRWQGVEPGGRGGEGGRARRLRSRGWARMHFADMASKLWAEAGIEALATRHGDHPTGSAFIFIDDATGDNAIIISPGVASTISPEDIDRQESQIAGARVFVAQLEQPLEAARRGLEIARANGCGDDPQSRTGLRSCRRYAGALRLRDPQRDGGRGAERDRGVGSRQRHCRRASHRCPRCRTRLYRDPGRSGMRLVRRYARGPCSGDAGRSGGRDDRRGRRGGGGGGGDAFNGGFAAALAHGLSQEDALRFSPRRRPRSR